MSEETKTAKPAAPKGGGKGPAKAGSGKKDKGTPASVTDAAPKVRDGMPRLQEFYVKTIRPKLAKQLLT